MMVSPVKGGVDWESNRHFFFDKYSLVYRPVAEVNIV